MEQRVKIGLQLEQNKYILCSRYQKWCKFFKSPYLAFQAFCRAKVEMLKFSSRNRLENEHNIKCMDSGAMVVQLRRHKWLGL